MNNQNNTRDFFSFYRSFYDALKYLPLESNGKLYNAIFEYAFNFNKPDLEKLNSIEKMVWILIEPNISKSISQFKNGKQAKSKPTRSQSEAKSKPTASEDKDKDKDKELRLKNKIQDKELRLKNKIQDKELDKEKKEDKENNKINTVSAKADTCGSNKFIKPTFIELNNHIQEKGYSFKAEEFISHYESNGWRVGRNPMKCWRSACVNWSRNNFNKGKVLGKNKEEIVDRINYFLAGIKNDKA